MKALLLVLAACGSSSSCPKAEQLGNAEEAKIIVKRCRADGWSKEVTDCLKAAKTEEESEPCLDKLGKEQQKMLRDDFKPLRARMETAEKAEVIAHVAEDIAALHLGELVARDAACAAYKTAVDDVRNRLARCGSPSISLEAYGVTEQLRSDVKALRALPDAQLGAECTTHAKALDELSVCQ